MWKFLILGVLAATLAAGGQAYAGEEREPRDPPEQPTPACYSDPAPKEGPQPDHWNDGTYIYNPSDGSFSTPPDARPGPTLAERIERSINAIRELLTPENRYEPTRPEGSAPRAEVYERETRD